MPIYMLYCDFNTVSFNPEYVETILSTHSDGYIKAGENLWLFAYKRRFNDHYLADIENFINNHFKTHLTSDSAFYIADFNDSETTQYFPEAVNNFLESTL